MADFVSGFWNVYVMGLVALSLLFCLFVLMSNNKRETGPVELHGHVWDENLAEYNNPLPRWWLYLFWLTLVFAVVYLILYPGFGNAKGLLGWASVGQYETEIRKAEERYAPIFAKYQGMDVAAVAADPEARGMGQRLFVTYCAQCHGSDARGAKGFPNLTDKAWHWGGDPETIKATVTNGRIGVMPPLGPTLGAGGVKDVANYVRSLSGLAHDSLRAQRGAELFQQNCAACHGAEAKGMPAMGAPDLSDDAWLYGSSEATIMETVTKGRMNRMPGFGEFLGEAKVHLLTAYVYGLSNKPAQ
ncbi:cytochrome-c oxidase, cbb3-type subunit III [Aromatoleum buckelii]|uniref:Cbb3-type cytochrome c oxidase subunit n=1 Tax=Aromatoleum buckelii TaxID=200254 RepID=A0ABX1N746_9RHOO|nr:cytochrome-c oxidase, cbb3-type subunit III [Aromatoleum buckelii]MCK0511281.1 cytochrome-c oxidase, cbb3-type subunit III [Aromatoleum buckelii]